MGKIHFYPVISSTNDEAARHARAGAAEGEIFVAERQTAGRGRTMPEGSRQWDSSGENLYLSFLLRPPLAPAEAPLLTLAAGKAVFETLASLLEEGSLKIKQPNDIYWQNKKIAGILTESEIKGEKLNWVVVGIGININASLSDFSPEVQKTATSLKLIAGKNVSLEKFRIELIENFEKNYLVFLNGGKETVLDFCRLHSYSPRS